MRTLPKILRLLLLCLFAACIPAQGDRHISTALDCQQAQKQQPQRRSTNAVEITVAANAYRDFCWKLSGVIAASAQLGADAPVVRPVLQNMSDSAFQELLADAFATSNAPDIIALNHTTVERFAQAGYLAPLDECRRQHRQFDQIRAAAWSQVQWRQQTWGIPFDIGTFFLYFNQQKLAALNWSTAEIADLPRQIETGQFTLDDLLAVAQQAIQRGVASPGFGFWPHLADPWTLPLVYVAHGGRLFDEATQKLVITQAALTKAYTFHHTIFQRGLTHPNLANPDHAYNDLTMWEDAVAHGRVLFWVGGNHNWPMLTFEYRDDLLPSVAPTTTFGVALFPAAQPGQTGKALWVQTGFYAISAPRAGQHSQQQAACALLAQTLTPAIAIRHSARSGFMSTLNPEQLAPYWQEYPFVKAQAQMWPYLMTVPHHRSTDTDQYVAILTQHLTQVQRGLLSAEGASDLVVQELQEQLSEAVLIE